MNLGSELQKLEMERSPWVSLVDQLPDWDLPVLQFHRSEVWAREDRRF